MVSNTHTTAAEARLKESFDKLALALSNRTGFPCIIKYISKTVFDVFIDEEWVSYFRIKIKQDRAVLINGEIKATLDVDWLVTDNRLLDIIYDEYKALVSWDDKSTTKF